jgi:hypothetical protein
VPNEISSDQNIIDLDVSSDRRQAKLKRPSYNLGKADWEKLREDLTRTEPSSLSSNPKEATIEFTNWITKACDNSENVYKWIAGDNVDFLSHKNEKQTNLYRRRLNKTLDLEARERAQNAFRNCLRKFKAAIRTAKENTWKKYVEDMNRDA